MNERGFGLKESMLFIVTIMICIFVTMFMYSKNFNELFAGNQKTTYEDIEKQLVGATKTYTDNYYYKLLENGDNDYVTIKQLKKEEIISDIADIKDKKIKCNGYVTFSKNEGKVTYTPYIKCGKNYKTKDYNSRFEK